MLVDCRAVALSNAQYIVNDGLVVEYLVMSDTVVLLRVDRMMLMWWW